MILVVSLLTLYGVVAVILLRHPAKNAVQLKEMKKTM
ncbi:hypothetical protein JOC54_002088 [Alkalihalobacillus xiaoxiensis]|uniref:Uncharacterized protein n=1 Tax=Shouchella xiaoxiensis TaxID=766895 RepID=A0ABS2STN3_9BACI|nr:hypothetical protein [Shouchella xiaoxiensis]